MTFEEKLDRVITLLECLLEDKARNVGFTHVKTTTDLLPEETQPKAQFTHEDIRKIVSDKKSKGISAQDLKEVLNKCGYSKITDIADNDIDSVYNAFLSL